MGALSWLPLALAAAPSAHAADPTTMTDGFYVVDTSRHGNGSNGQWCDPSGMIYGY
ncbi:hypothetical protein GCM10009837_46920 [Streptomyces durmitorensis]|uniref:Uncharacterized protein n=1 Tax=Streptomyces durmitorensis TaxID=319947 RepID=A0ABY4Q2L5_9ACTN|nr:hypothetical protein [Streptomyces durmitorensis]UQT60331.1 hypothetical protein M4V62_37645 [Streptomyces durmitorensis]